jgi:hypothetical protein
MHDTRCKAQEDAVVSLRNAMAVLTAVVVTVATALLVWSTSTAIGAEAPTASDVLLSKGRRVTASSSAACCPVQAAVDGRDGTRWASAPDVDHVWLTVDLGAAAAVHQIRLVWDTDCAAAYELQLSGDRTTWHTVAMTTAGTGGTESLGVAGTGRFVRLVASRRCQPEPGHGYTLREFQVFGTTDVQAPVVTGALRLVGPVQPTSVTLDWDPATDNVGVASYTVSAGAGVSTTTPGGTTRVTVTGLRPRTTYRFTLTARDGAGNVSGHSNTVIVTTPDATADRVQLAGVGRTRRPCMPPSTARAVPVVEADSGEAR